MLHELYVDCASLGDAHPAVLELYIVQAEVAPSRTRNWYLAAHGVRFWAEEITATLAATVFLTTHGVKFWAQEITTFLAATVFLG